MQSRNERTCFVILDGCMYGDKWSALANFDEQFKFYNKFHNFILGYFNLK